MRRLLFVIVIFLAMVSCRTTRESVNKDLKVEMSQQKDSVSVRKLLFDEGSITEIQRNVYDSVITHITIFRYDTIFVDGSPAIKEKIEVDQVRISGDYRTEQTRDSMKSSEVDIIDVAYEDTITIQKHELTQKIKSDKRNAVFVMILIVCCLVCACIILIKKIVDMYRV